MDVTNALNNSAISQMSERPQAAPKAPESERDQAQRNALNMLQARYGEKPKEARAVHKQLDKDDFMKIMLNEMKHQDPTKPMDSDKMAAQMAQLTSVEQLKNMNASMDRLVEKNNSSDRLAMSAMIGKMVTVDKSRFSHTKGTIAPLNYTLPENATRVKMTILDDRGEEIFTRELEAQKSGLNTYNWEGLGQNGVPVKTGSYSVKIDAENEKGAPVKIDPISHEAIVGVAFDGGETNFLVGDPKQPQKIPMRSVVKIEGPQLSRIAQDKKAEAEKAAADPTAPKKDTSFELPDVLKEKIAAQSAGKINSETNGQAPQVAAAKAEAPEEPVKAEGFANGLHE